VQCLVESAPSRLESFCENVDRDAVDRERDEHASLVRGQNLVDRLPQRRHELGLVGLCRGLEPRARDGAPGVVLERELTSLPGSLAQLDRRLEQRELVDPRRKAAGAAKVVETAKHVSIGMFR